MMACELIKDLLELEQKSEVVFVKRNDLPYIYLIGFMPDGTKVAAEMPTAIEKPKENK
jgi:hypothetical protein